MDIKITHVFDLSPAVLDLLGALNRAAPVSAVKKAIVETPAKPFKEPEAPAKAAETDEAPAKPKKAAKKAAAPAEDHSDITIDEDGARAIIKRLAATDGAEGEAGGIDFAKGILKKYGAEGVKQLDESKYEDFIDEVKELLATGGFKKHGKPPAKQKAAEEVF